MALSERAIKWLLFTAMFLTVPVLYFMFVIGGFVPLWTILVLTLVAPLSFVHVMLYAPVFYLVSILLAKGLMRMPNSQRTIAFVTICALLIGVTFLPIYGVSHGKPQYQTLYRMTLDLWK